MPEFDFRAVDGFGRPANGRMAGASANEVIARLSQQGLVVQGLDMVGSIVTQTAGRGSLDPIVLGGNDMPPAVDAGIFVGTQVATVVGHSMANRPVSSGVGRGTVQPKMTGFLKDYDQWMLLNQMGTILRAGIGPTQMLEELSQRASLKSKVRRALAEMARMTGTGSALSDAMAVYPEIFPVGVSGSVRAGEAGGYLPDALLHTSQQIQESWKVRRWYLWTSTSIFSTVILLPLIPVFRKGAEGLGATLNNGMGENQDFVGQYLGALKAGMMGWPLVGMILICAFFLLGPYLFGRIGFLGLRHGLAAKMPLVGRRTRLETARELGFHLEKLSVAGISPYRAFGLAAGAIPNKIYRDKLVATAKPWREDATFSQMLPRDLVPDDLVDLIRTGELTGTTSESFQTIQRLAQTDKENTDKILKVKSVVWIMLFVFGISSIIGAVMISQFYGVMWDAIFEGTGW